MISRNFRFFFFKPSQNYHNCINIIVDDVIEHEGASYHLITLTDQGCYYTNNPNPIYREGDINTLELL